MNKRLLLIISAFFVLTVLNGSFLGKSALEDMQLNILGSVNENYNESQISSELPTIIGYGGYMKRTGSIFQPAKWKGINLPVFFISLVGQTDYNVSVISEDESYTVNLTKSEIEGAIRTFDEENNTLAIKAIPCLAYEEEDSSLSLEDGPLRLVFIGEDNQSILTTSSMWVKQARTIYIETSNGTTTTLPTTTLSSTTSVQTSETTGSTSSQSINFPEYSFLSFLIIVGVFIKKKLSRGK